MRKSTCILEIFFLLFFSVQVGLGQARMQIKKLSPATAAPGDVVNIIGRQFGKSQGKKYVTMSRAVNGKPVSYPMDVTFWSDARIGTRIPSGIPSDGYLVVIYDGLPTRYSNNKKLVVTRAEDNDENAAMGQQSVKKDPVRLDRAKVRSRDADTRKTDKLAQGGMFIEKVYPAVAESGESIEILGRDFGKTQGDKVVAINGDNRVHVMKVLDWSDSLIRARIPRDLDEGKYLVLVYYDESYRLSSNSKKMIVEAGPKKKSASSIKPDMWSSDVQAGARPQEQPPPPAVKGGRPEKKVALVLQGGGAYGAFQAGVIESLYNRGFRPSIIVGTSVGSLNGAKLAEGYEGVHNDLVDLWMSLIDEGGGEPLQEGSYILGKSIYLRNPRYEAFLERIKELEGSAEGLLPIVVASMAFDPPAVGIFRMTAARMIGELIEDAYETVTELDATTSQFIQTPLAQLVTQQLSPERVANSGIQLRLAAMTVDGGELRYFTETGAIESEDGQLIMRGRVAGPALHIGSTPSDGGGYIHYWRPMPSVGDGVMASSAIPIIFQPWVVHGGEAYWDGAVRESLPLRKAFDLGATDVIGVLTGPMERRSVLRDPRYSLVIHEIRAIDNFDNNGADFFARVKIGDYDYRKTRVIDNNDTPSPDWRFDLNPTDLKNMEGSVTFDIWEENSIEKNDPCDAHPDADHKQINININIGSGHIGGDVEGETGDKWLVRGGGDGNRVEVLFSVLRQTPAGPLGQIVPVDLMPLRRIVQLASQFHAESGIEDMRVLEPIDVLQNVAATAGVPAAIEAMHATGEEIARRSMRATGEEGHAMISGLAVPRYLLVEAPVIVGEMIDFDLEIIKVNYQIGTIVGERTRLALLGDAVPNLEEEGRIEAEVRSRVLSMLRVEAERWREAAQRGAGRDPLMWKRYEYIGSAIRQLERTRVMLPRRSRVRP